MTGRVGTARSFACDAQDDRRVGVEAKLMMTGGFSGLFKEVPKNSRYNQAMPFEIIHDDITLLHVDAIVNATNPWQEVGSGVSRAIYNAAGFDELAAACAGHGNLRYGEAFATSGFQLPAKTIIHTATPRFSGGLDGEYEVLESCYLNSLELALKLKCKSVAFPLLGSGGQGFPEVIAFRLASNWILQFLEQNDMDISLVIYDRATTRPDESVSHQLERVFDLSSPDKFRERRRGAMPREELQSAQMPMLNAPFVARPAMKQSAKDSLEEQLQEMQTSFSPALLKLIDQSGKTDPQIYKKANLTRQHFSKIRTNPGYIPNKITVLALAIALELSVEQTQDLLSRAGYTLSKSLKMDLIVEYYLRKKLYDIYQINETLFYYEQPLLGSRVN